MGCVARRLDALRRRCRYRLAGRNVRARPQSDVGRRPHDAGTRRARQVSGDTGQLKVSRLLLPGLLERKFTFANSRTQAIGECGGGLFTIGGYKLRKGRKKAGLRQAVAVNAIVARFRPSLMEVAKCHKFLLAIGYWLARVDRILGYRHFSHMSLGVQADAHSRPKMHVSTGIAGP